MGVSYHRTFRLGPIRISTRNLKIVKIKIGHFGWTAKGYH